MRTRPQPTSPTATPSGSERTVDAINPAGRDSPQEPDTEDSRLVERMLEGDADAFEEFSDRFVAGLYRFAYSRLDRNHHLTEEIVQITLCKAVTKLSTFRGEASLFTWLRACCRNEILMHLRKKRSTPRLVEIDADPHHLQSHGNLRSQEPRADVKLMRAQRHDRVHEALDLLPEHYAKALGWKYLEKIPVKEIGERLDLSAKAAESLLTRARLAFKRVYEELSEQDEATPFPFTVETNS